MAILLAVFQVFQCLMIMDKNIENDKYVSPRFYEVSFLISELIQLELKQRKLTRAKFAELAGVSVRTVYRWLTGSYNFRLNQVVLLERLFDITILNLDISLKNNE